MTQDATIYDDLRVHRQRAVLRGPGTERHSPRGGRGDRRRRICSEHRSDYCANLSGGQRSRVSLACALVGQPDLLVLDEPTIGLDPVLRAELWEQFGALARRGTTLLVSSHVMDEADHCGDLLLMRDGRLLARTTPTTTARGDRMHVAGGGVPVASSGAPPRSGRLSALLTAALSGHHAAHPATARAATTAASR